MSTALSFIVWICKNYRITSEVVSGISSPHLQEKYGSDSAIVSHMVSAHVFVGPTIFLFDVGLRPSGDFLEPCCKNPHINLKTRIPYPGTAI